MLVIFIPPLATPSTEVAQVISETLANREPFRGPIAAVFPDPQSDLVTIPAGERVVPVYDFPESAVAALSAAARYGTWRATPAGHRVPIAIDRDTLDRVLAENSGHAGWLSQTDVARLLGAAGIAVDAFAIGAFARRSRRRRRRVRPAGGDESRGAGGSPQIRCGRSRAQYRAGRSGGRHTRASPSDSRLMASLSRRPASRRWPRAASR